ncbi:hypothetical protein Tco_1343501 [Tanacetum coccineum]
MSAVHKELGDRMERAATTASSLEAEQDSGSGPRCQDTILEDVDAFKLDEGVQNLLYPRFLQVFINQQLEDMSHHKKTFVNPFHIKKIFAYEESKVPIIDQPSTSSQPKKKQKSRRKQRKEAETAHAETEEEEHFNTPSNDPLPSGEDSMKLNELMALCTQLQQQVLDLEKAKSDQAIEIASLKKRVDKLEKRRQLRTTGLTRFKKFGTARRVKSSNAGLGALRMHQTWKSIEVYYADAEVTISTKLDDSTAGEAVTTASVEDSDALIIQVSTADIGEVTAAKINELTLTQTLI